MLYSIKFSSVRRCLRNCGLVLLLSCSLTLLANSASAASGGTKIEGGDTPTNISGIIGSMGDKPGGKDKGRKGGGGGGSNGGG